MTMNVTNIKTSSDGIFEGDNALHTAFPLLIIQTTLILLVTRLLAFAFKPLRQPKVIAEIVGGILLGPSGIGRNQAYINTIFPAWSTPILESVASIGLLFFLFLVGLELDLSSILRTGRHSFTIALAGITLPFATGAALSLLLRTAIPGPTSPPPAFAPFLLFIAVSLSITAFPVLSRILAELKLLTTPLGHTALSAAAFNDLAAWILLALAVSLSGTSNKTPLVPVYVLLCGVGFIVLMFLVAKPAMSWVAKRNNSSPSEVYITMTLAGVLVSGFITDLIGIHSIFGAFIFGLVIPKEGGFGRRLIERIEDFVMGLLLPLYFASSGLKTDVTKIQGGVAWGVLGLVIVVACFGKIVGTFSVAVCCRIKVREALVLGVLMNTKGLVELIVLNIGKEKKVLNDEMFAILVLMALFTTFITTPIVMAIYKPARSPIDSPNRKLQPDPSKNGSSLPTTRTAKDEFRILACAHGPGNVPGLINLIESTRSPAHETKLKLYIMHLVELTERPSSIIMVQRLRRNGLPSSRVEAHDQVASAFETYAQLGNKVMVRPVTDISALSTMHEDVCHVAQDKTVILIILPFHKMWRKNQSTGDVEVDNVGHGWRGVNQRVLKEARCSVAVFVDRGFDVTRGRRMCVVFFGGPDDRAALEIGGRMADHPTIHVSVIRFGKSEIMINGNNNKDDNNNNNNDKLVTSVDKISEHHYSFSVATFNRVDEKAQDDAAISEFRNKWEGTVEYSERIPNNVEEEVLALGKSGVYELIIVGKARFPTTIVAQLANRQAEHPELGPIGDILSSSNTGVVSSVLVVQQHDLVRTDEEVDVPKVVRNPGDGHHISDQV
ncbi:hypothetical protein vseg_020571 [Gypsophila vaccaria]